MQQQRGNFLKVGYAADGGPASGDARTAIRRFSPCRNGSGRIKCAVNLPERPFRPALLQCDRSCRRLGAARGIGRAPSLSARPRERPTAKAKTRRSGGLCISDWRSGKLVCLATTSFPDPGKFRKRVSCHGQGAPDARRSRRAASAAQGSRLCSHSSPSPSTCTAPSAGICTGRCRTSWRSPTAPAGASPPSARSPRPQGSPGARCPAIWRNWPRRASSRASGALAASMPTLSRPASCRRSAGVSHSREKGVPPAGREEQAGKKTGYARARFAKSRGQLRRDPRRAQQVGSAAAGWRKSRFWLPSFGPRPTEPGCFAPPDLWSKTG